MGPRREPLNAAVAAAFEVFAGPKPEGLGVCRGCCMDAEIEADFLNHGQRELPAHYLADWFFAAYADDLGKRHVAWILPRMLELVAAGEDVAAVGNEAAFGRLRQAGHPEAWSAEERAVVADFFAALMDAFLDDPGAWSWSLDDLLCMAGQAGADMAPLLARLDAAEDGALVAALWSDIGWRAGHPPCSAFWDRTPQQAQVWAWFTDPALADRMLRAGIENPDATIRARALTVAEGILAASDPPQG